ncbi:hypothetical protein ANO11243_027440 [Dothideomycetidae sp. 11243]|nr:hypothetical protein ANO11243_027440 [fungal sp. No.11243]
MCSAKHLSPASSSFAQIVAGISTPRASSTAASCCNVCYVVQLQSRKTFSSPRHDRERLRCDRAAVVHTAPAYRKPLSHSASRDGLEPYVQRTAPQHRCLVHAWHGRDSPVWRVVTSAVVGRNLNLTASGRRPKYRRGGRMGDHEVFRSRSLVRTQLGGNRLSSHACASCAEICKRRTWWPDAKMYTTSTSKLQHHERGAGHQRAAVETRFIRQNGRAPV